MISIRPCQVSGCRSRIAVVDGVAGAAAVDTIPTDPRRSDIPAPSTGSRRSRAARHRRAVRPQRASPMTCGGSPGGSQERDQNIDFRPDLKVVYGSAQRHGRARRPSSFRCGPGGLRSTLRLMTSAARLNRIGGAGGRHGGSEEDAPASKYARATHADPAPRRREPDWGRLRSTAEETLPRPENASVTADDADVALGTPALHRARPCLPGQLRQPDRPHAPPARCGVGR